jgi:nicotinamide-nucleotide amidase
VIAQAVFDGLKARGWMLATAESCTGGMVAAAITDIAGSSDVFDRGFVTYSNTAKAEALGVSRALIERHGAVSEQVARAMAEGALARSKAHVAVAITGIAGPSGGSDNKPVGLVHFACAIPQFTRHDVQRFGPLDRAAIRSRAVIRALDLILEVLAT